MGTGAGSFGFRASTAAMAASSTTVAQMLDSGPYSPPVRSVWDGAQETGHGGHLYIVSSAASCAAYIEIKYKLQIPFQFGADAESEPAVRRAKDGVTYADLVARFTAVDGSVVLTKDLDLLGFGTETLVDKVSWRTPQMYFVGQNGKQDRTKHFDDNGMRHRACYHFCNHVEDSVALIVSQDGVVKACTKNDGKVVVYDHVSLPI